MDEKRVKVRRAKVLGLSQLLAKKYDFLTGLPDNVTRSFGQLVANFTMIIYGASGSGKSTLVYQLLNILMAYTNVLYLSLEEGYEATVQMRALSQLNVEEHNGKILFADHSMTIEELRIRLKKRNSPRVVVVDSVQYWRITYAQYCKLKEEFSSKTFIFISHANGSKPHGSTAKSIEYDVGVKVKVEGGVAFVQSRYGFAKPYIIIESDAIEYWGKKKVNDFKK